MVYSRETALKNAEKATTCVPGTCQKWTRELYNAPSAGDRDHDGDADAVDGWKSETKVHVGDRNPPAGVPVAFSGGRKGYGHRAISRGNGNLRSTDMLNGKYTAGRVGNATIAQIEKSMGVKYLGWSETITGLKIPTAKDTPPPAKPPVQQVSFVLDVSHHQFDKGFKLKMAWDQGYRHVILKCTQGVRYVDPAFKAALFEADKLGFKVAVYHFLEHQNAAKQAENLARNIIDKGLPVWIDVEPTRTGTPDVSRPTLRDWVTFRDTIGKLGLRCVGKYLGESYWNELRRPSLVGPLDLWRPAYPRDTHSYASKLYPGNNHERWNSFGGQKPSLWQFTQNAKINGYSGGVDVSAYRGTHAELDREGWFKDLGQAPKPIPEPKPTPKPEGLDFRLHLVPSNFHSPHKEADVKAEQKIVKDNSGPNAVLFNTELHSQALRKLAMTTLGSGWTGVLENEVTVSYSKNWTAVGKPVGVRLAKEDPSKAKVSPARALNEVPLENSELKDVPVMFLNTHWVSEANCVHVNVPARAWREQNYKAQLRDVLNEVERLHKEGYPIVLGGDFNTGVYFKPTELLAKLQARVTTPIVHAYAGNLDSIFLISTDKVKLTEKGVEKKTKNASDHDMVTVTVHVEKV